MARFNTATQDRSKTKNLAGGNAYVESPQLELVSILLTSFVKDQFYRSAENGIDRVGELVQALPDKKFAAKAAVFARNEFGMRSISHVTAGEIANQVKGENWTRRFFDRVIRRPDDAMEIMSYYLGRYGKQKTGKSGQKVNRGIPNAMKKGFRSALARFDEYQIAKYRGESRDMSLIDVINLITGRKPDLINTDAIKKLSRDQLTSGKSTWEGQQTGTGNKVVEGLCEACAEEYKKFKDQAKSEGIKRSLKDFDGMCDECKSKRRKEKGSNWTKLLKENKLGYMALLKNLRNIMAEAPDVLDQALERLTDREQIKKSLVLPFRFLTAIEEIKKVSMKGSREVVIALCNALDISCDNVPKFEGDTLVVVDDSGSMEAGHVNCNFGQSPIDIAALFAAIIMKVNPGADYMQFSNDARYRTLNPLDSTLTIAKSIIDSTEAGGTNFHSIFQTAKRKYDRIIILSDMQGWMDSGGLRGRYGYADGGSPDSSHVAYKNKFKCNPHVYSFDLCGYGTLQFPEPRVYALAGFSEKVFDMMGLLAQDRNVLINKIEDVEL